MRRISAAHSLGRVHNSPQVRAMHEWFNDFIWFAYDFVSLINCLVCFIHELVKFIAIGPIGLAIFPLRLLIISVVYQWSPSLSHEVGLLMISCGLLLISYNDFPYGSSMISFRFNFSRNLSMILCGLPMFSRGFTMCGRRLFSKRAVFTMQQIDFHNRPGRRWRSN